MAISTVSFGNTPQAKDDYLLAGLTEDSTGIVCLDVMANDLGGNAKTLWSLDNGTSTYVSGDPARPVDLLTQDTARTEALTTDTSLNGAKIWITTDGKVKYDSSTWSSTFKDQLNQLQAGEFLTDSFTYAIRLGNGTLSWATAYVQISGANDAPTSTNDSVTTNEDTAVTLGVNDFGTFSDVDGDPLAAVKITALPTDGSLQYFNGASWVAVALNQEISAADLTAGKLRFVPDLNESATAYATIGFKVGDGTAFSVASYVLTLNVTADADAPSLDLDKGTANDQHAGSATGNEDTAIALDISAALTDTDGSETLALVISGIPVGAKLSDGIHNFTATLGNTSVDITSWTWASLTVTPPADSHADFALTVTATATELANSDTASTVGTINVTVNAVADIVDDTATTNEDTAVTTNVLANDTFEDPARELTSFTQGANGTVTRDDNGTAGDLTDDKLIYTPNADFNGTDSYTYTVTSGGVTETATVNVTINAVADIANDSATTNEDTKVTTNVLANDTFEDSTRALTSFTQGTNGTVTRDDNGTAGDLTDDKLIYTPNADFNGADSYTYTVTSGGVTETATVNVTVNAVADIVADTVTTTEDAAISFNPITGTNGAEADNFEGASPQITEINGTAISVGGSVAVTNGSVSLGAGNVLTFTPDADFNGAVPTFTYTVLSGGVTETGNIDVTVTAVADIADDSATTNEDTKVTTDVLANDTFEDPARELTSFTQGTNGTVTRDDNGTAGDLTDDKLIYTPNADFNGADSYTYTVTSGGVTETATVNVTINAVADIVNDTATTNEDTAVTTNVLANDTFEDPARELTSFTQGANGTVTRDDNGTAGDLTDDKLIYTPNADFNGADSYTYTVTSGGVTETATVNVTVNAVADIVADSATTNEDTKVTTDVLPNDTFEDPARALTSFTQGTNGTVTRDDNGTAGDLTDDKLVYTPNADFNGADSYTYTVTSGGGVTETATVNVTVNAVADIVDDTATTNEDTKVTTNVLANDTFEDPARELTSFTQGTNGTVTRDDNGTVGDLTDDKLIYTPNADFNGADSYTYTVTSGGVTETATINVTVSAVADIANDSATTNEDTKVTTNVLANDTFEDPARELTSFTQGTNGTVTRDDNGTAGDVTDDKLIYTPNADFNGADSYTYTVTSGGVTETATVNVTVNAVADIANDSATTNEDTKVTTNVLANDTFEDPARALTSFAQGTNGTVTRDDNGTAGDLTDDKLVYTPNADFNGADNYTYTVTSGGVTETATVNVTINAVVDIVADTVTANQNTPISFNPITGTNGAEADNFESASPQITQINGAAISVGGSVAVTNGSVSLGAGNVLTFTPAAGFTGTVPNFTYTVLSGGVTETTTITVTVTATNVAPVPHADVWVLSDQTPIAAGTITAAWFTNNDTDADGNPLFVTAVTGLPVGLTANFDGAGHLIDITGTTPATSFTLGYTLSDGIASVVAANSVTVTVLDTTSGDNKFTLDGNDFSYIDALSGTDTLTGDAVLTGNAGIDKLVGNNGDDTLSGGAGNDFLFGNENDDVLNGDAGDDSLDGGNGKDTVSGGAGNDILTGGAASDTITGGQGNDTIDVSDGDDRVLIASALDGKDVVSGFDNAGGSGAQDFIDLDALFDTLGVASGAARDARVDISTSGGNTLVKVDVNGAGGFDEAGDLLITLTGVTSGITKGTAAADDIQLG